MRIELFAEFEIYLRRHSKKWREKRKCDVLSESKKWDSRGRKWDDGTVTGSVLSFNHPAEQIFRHWLTPRDFKQREITKKNQCHCI